MPFQPIHFSQLQTVGLPWVGDFHENLQKGMQTYNMPQQARQQFEAKELANALAKEKSLQAQATTPFAGPQAEANLAYRLAQAKQMEQQAENPLLNQLTGIAKEVEGLEYLRRAHGENSQVYKNAMRRFESDLRSSDILNEYRQTLSGTAEKKAATPFRKLEMEIEDIKNRSDIPPVEKERLIEMARLAQIKGVTLPEFQKRSAFASNIDKTLEKINPDHLVRYAGAFGAGRKLGSAGLASLGLTLKNYKQYENALTATKLLAKQVRQFYGDSITPEVQAQLRELTNPDSWKNNPEIAKSKFLTFKDLLLKETQTYKNLLTNTREYRMTPEGNRKTLESQRSEAVSKNIKPNAPPKKEPAKRYKYVNGNIVNA